VLVLLVRNSVSSVREQLESSFGECLVNGFRECLVNGLRESLVREFRSEKVLSLIVVSFKDSHGINRNSFNGNSFGSK
jgi:hypothetical protein